MKMTINTRWLCLPLAAALFSAAWAQAPAGSTQGTAVVHTAESARAVMDRTPHVMLAGEGAEVSLAEGGLEGVKLAQTTQPPFDAILMDCRLPNLDGYEATQRIRLLPNGIHVPIIALTANALQGDRERCMAAGMDDYLSKPLRRTELQRALQRWLPGQTTATGDKC